jgi:hypothetical protein
MDPRSALRPSSPPSATAHWTAFLPPQLRGGSVASGTALRLAARDDGISVRAFVINMNVRIPSKYVMMMMMRMVMIMMMMIMMMMVIF